MDWIAGLPTTEGWFNTIQNHVDLLLGKVHSSYHKNTSAKVEQANSVISDTLCAYASGRKDDWDRQLPLAVFAINNMASTLGDGLTHFFIDLGEHPHLPLTALVAGSLRAAYAQAGAAGERALGGRAA